MLYSFSKLPYGNKTMSSKQSCSTPANWIKTPAAIAEPITPATFGPIACISKKFCGFDSNPTLFATLDAIGTAETPAAPINGLICVELATFMSFAIKTPLAVPIANAPFPK